MHSERQKHISEKIKQCSSKGMDVNSAKRFDELSNLFFPYLIEEYKCAIAKSNGTTLYEHTLHVWEELVRIKSKRKKTFEKYCTISGKSLKTLEECLFRTVFLHDMGKKHVRWQNFIKDTKANYQTLNYRHETMGIYPLLDVLKTKYVSRDHLFEKILECSDILFPILAHHNNLSRDRIIRFDNQYPEKYKRLLWIQRSFSSCF